MNNGYKNSRIESDKIYCLYLMAASFSGLIKFDGCMVKGDTLYWQFSPEIKTVELISRFHTKTEPRIPAKDIFEAVEIFWRQVNQLKIGGTDYGNR